MQTVLCVRRSVHAARRSVTAFRPARASGAPGARACACGRAGSGGARAARAGLAPRRVRRRGRGGDAGWSRARGGRRCCLEDRAGRRRRRERALARAGGRWRPCHVRWDGTTRRRGGDRLLIAAVLAAVVVASAAGVASPSDSDVRELERADDTRGRAAVAGGGGGPLTDASRVEVLMRGVVSRVSQHKQQSASGEGFAAKRPRRICGLHACQSP